MFNIGLESLQQHAYIGPGDESSTYEFIDILKDISGYLDTIFNLSTIRQSLQTYGNTPQLKDLVGKSFEEYGVIFSIEGIGESIKEFFIWIKETIVNMWKSFWKLFGFYKDDDNKAKQDNNEVQDIARSKPNFRLQISNNIPKLIKQASLVVESSQKISNILKEILSLVDKNNADVGKELGNSLTLEITQAIDRFNQITQEPDTEVEASAAIIAQQHEQIVQLNIKLTAIISEIRPSLTEFQNLIPPIERAMIQASDEDRDKFNKVISTLKEFIDIINLILKSNSQIRNKTTKVRKNLYKKMKSI